MSHPLKTIEPTLFELSRPGRAAVELPAPDVPAATSAADLLPDVASAG
jgi:hypothetical protein